MNPNIISPEYVHRDHLQITDKKMDFEDFVIDKKVRHF